MRCKPSGGCRRICSMRRSTSASHVGGGVLRARDCQESTCTSSGGAVARRLTHLRAQSEERPSRAAICLRVRSGRERRRSRKAERSACHCASMGTVPFGKRSQERQHNNTVPFYLSTCASCQCLPNLRDRACQQDALLIV